MSQREILNILKKYEGKKLTIVDIQNELKDEKTATAVYNNLMKLIEFQKKVLKRWSDTSDFDVISYSRDSEKGKRNWTLRFWINKKLNKTENTESDKENRNERKTFINSDN